MHIEQQEILATIIYISHSNWRHCCIDMVFCHHQTALSARIVTLFLLQFKQLFVVCSKQVENILGKGTMEYSSRIHQKNPPEGNAWKFSKKASLISTECKNHM